MAWGERRLTPANTTYTHTVTTAIISLDEAPLAWSVTEALNTRLLAHFGVAYDIPLPEPFVDFISDLIEVEEPAPSLSLPVVTPLATRPARCVTTICSFS